MLSTHVDTCVRAQVAESDDKVVKLESEMADAVFQLSETRRTCDADLAELRKQVAFRLYLGCI